MIAKIIKGADFHRLALYLMKNGRGEVIDMRHLSSETSEEAASEMHVAASVSRRTQQPVMHIVVSYDPADGEPSNADMARDAGEVLRGLGLDKNQAVVIRHRDRDHAHMHIMCNRVGPDGRAVSDSQSYPRAEAALRRIERRRGLIVTPGRNAPDPATGRRMSGDRTTIDPRQHKALEGVRQALLTAQSWRDLHSGLARHGWRAETVQRGKGRGLILIGPEGQRIGAGQIDRTVTLSRLRARFADRQHHPAPVSSRAVLPAALAKPHGKKPKRKPAEVEDRMKAAMRTGTEVIGALVSGAVYQPLIGQRRGIGSALMAGKLKRRPRSGRGLGL